MLHIYSLSPSYYNEKKDIVYYWFNESNLANA